MRFTEHCKVCGGSNFRRLTPPANECMNCGAIHDEMWRLVWDPRKGHRRPSRRELAPITREEETRLRRIIGGTLKG